MPGSPAEVNNSRSMSEPESIVVKGAREHNLKSVHARDSEEEAGRLHRRLRLGEELARLRHPLRRRTAPLRRVALVVRPAVPRADGEAQVRHHPRPLADHLHRAEGGLQQPALDGRHHHRGARLPARALRLHRRPALPRRAAGRWASRRRSRLSTRSSGCRRARASCSSRRSSRTARASTRTARRRAQARLRPRAGGRGRPLARGAARARQEAEARHRARHRPPGGEGGPARPAHRLGRDGAAGGQGDAHRRRGRAASRRWGRGSTRRSTRSTTGSSPSSTPATSCGLSFGELARRTSPSTARSGACPECQGLGTKRRDGPGPHHPRSVAHHPGGRGRPWASGMEKGEGWTFEFVEHLARALEIDLDTPWSKLPKAQRETVLAGTEGHAPAAHRDGKGW